MAEFELFVATQASQAGTLPVLLVASSINEARPYVGDVGPEISIHLERTD